MAGDKTGRIRREEDSRARQFIDFAKASHGCTEQKFAATFRSVEQGGIQFSTHDSGCDCIHTYAGLRPLDCKRSRETGNRSFAGAVGGHFVQSNEGSERTDINDAAITSLE